MEIVIAFLIAFGFITSDQSEKLQNDQAAVDRILIENKVTQDDLDKYKESILDLEDTDM